MQARSQSRVHVKFLHVPKKDLLPNPKKHEHMVRHRRFDLNLEKEGLNLFEGFKFRQYDNSLIKQTLMQKVAIRDQLFILTDKLASVKAHIMDGTFQFKMTKELAYHNLKTINLLMELVLALVNHICRILMYGRLHSPDLQQELQELGVAVFPVEEAKALKEGLLNEKQIYVKNADLFLATYAHYKDCTEIFFLICKQNSTVKVMTDKACEEILQSIEKSRYILGKINHSLSRDKEKFIVLQNEELARAEKIKKLEDIENSHNLHERVSESKKLSEKDKDDKPIGQLLENLYKLKFNTKRSDYARTKESKIDLAKEIVVSQLNFLEIHKSKKTRKKYGSGNFEAKRQEAIDLGLKRGEKLARMEQE